MSCVFLYYRFYYKVTFSVQVKPGPLWEGSWDPLRELCVPLLQVLLQGDTFCPNQAMTSLEGVLGPPSKTVWFIITTLYYKGTVSPQTKTRPLRGGRGPPSKTVGQTKTRASTKRRAPTPASVSCVESTPSQTSTPNEHTKPPQSGNKKMVETLTRPSTFFRLTADLTLCGRKSRPSPKLAVS